MTTQKQKALYPYTLQPVLLNMSQAEFKAAQLALFEQTTKNQSLMTLKTKEWIILAVITVLAVIGLISVKGYSTIIFWLMLIGVVVYLLLRTLGLKWYMKKEYEKQINSTEMPIEMSQMKIGIQPHGLIMSLPATQAPTTHDKRGMQMRGTAMQQAVIPWSAVTSWDETDDFVFMMFDVQNQKGSQIIPKRLHGNGFSVDTIKDHLSKVTPKGLKADASTPN